MWQAQGQTVAIDPSGHFGLVALLAANASIHSTNSLLIKTNRLSSFEPAIGFANHPREMSVGGQWSEAQLTTPSSQIQNSTDAAS